MQLTDTTVTVPKTSVTNLSTAYNMRHFCFSTPDKTADDIGMKELFKAVRTDSCEIYRCKEKTATTTATSKETIKGDKE
jgi:hypothetical protein